MVGGHGDETNPGHSDVPITAERLAEIETPRPTQHAHGDDGPTSALLTFRVGNAWLGVDANHVDEICDESTPLPVPGAPPYIPGLINVRGHAIPLLDLQRYLGIGQSEDGDVPSTVADSDSERGRIVLLAAGGMRVGLLCQQVKSIEQVGRSELRPPTTVHNAALSQIARAQRDVPGYLTLILDVPTLLESSRVRR